MIKVNASEIDETLREFEHFLNDRSGHFTTKLFQAMLVADRQNFYKLAQAFPNEGYAVACKFKPDELIKFQVVADGLEKI